MVLCVSFLSIFFLFFVLEKRKREIAGQRKWKIISLSGINGTTTRNNYQFSKEEEEEKEEKLGKKEGGRDTLLGLTYTLPPFIRLITRNKRIKHKVVDENCFLEEKSGGRDSLSLSSTNKKTGITLPSFSTKEFGEMGGGGNSRQASIIFWL